MMTQNGDSRRYCDAHDIVLKVENQAFYLEKCILREKCPYFEAMFSGKFAEDSQKEVYIEMISAKAMTFILNYLYFHEIDLLDLENVIEFIEASMFFQLQELVNLVAKSLLSKLNYFTWSKILQIAKKINLTDLEIKARCFGLYNFESVRTNIECIDNIEMLHWYLSHMYLNANNELDVFEAGCEWLTKSQSENIDNPDNGILVVLNCLHFQSIDKGSLDKILNKKLVQNNKIAKQVVESIIKILAQNINLECLSSKTYKSNYLEHISDSVYDVVCGFLLLSKERVSIEQPCVIRKRNDSCLKKFDSKKNELVDWLCISTRDCWGHNIVVWKGFNIIILCGETKVGKNIWNSNILLYNTLEEEWTIMNVSPVSPRRHAGAVIHQDFLYLIGGVNSRRILLSSVTRYDLNNDTWESLPDLPECCQSPVAAFHNGELYVSAEMLYVFRDNHWVHLFKISMRHNTIISYKDSLYFAQNWRSCLSYWKTDSVIEFMRSNEHESRRSKYNITSMCRIGKFIYFLTEPEHFEKQTYLIERCNLDDVSTTDTEVLMETPAGPDYSYNTSDCFAIPSVDISDLSINEFGKKWLDQNTCDHYTDDVDMPSSSNSNHLHFE